MQGCHADELRVVLIIPASHPKHDVYTGSPPKVSYAPMLNLALQQRPVDRETSSVDPWACVGVLS